MELLRTFFQEIQDTRSLMIHPPRLPGRQLFVIDRAEDGAFQNYNAEKVFKRMTTVRIGTLSDKPQDFFVLELLLT